MKQIKPNKKELIKQDYESAIKAYVATLCEMWEIEEHETWFVGGEIGTILCCNDDLFINMFDVIYCIENDIDIDEVYEWQEYCVRANDFNLPIMNLKSWHKGAPRISEEEFKKLEDMYDELEQETTNISEKYQQDGSNY